MSLNGEERRKVILELLDTFGKVSAKDLPERFGVTGETIRRDLDALEQENKLKKVYGGAIKVSWPDMEPPYLQRAARYQQEKSLIGRKAAEFVEDNDVILIDVGTTTLQTISHLGKRSNITIVTDSVPALTLLIEMKNNKLYDGHIFFIGGEVNAQQMTVSGPFSEKCMDELFVNKAFIATCGISLNNGLTSYDSQEASLSRKLISRAKQTFVLADSSKIGTTNLYKLADLSSIDAIISDACAPSEWKEELEKRNVTWITAE